MPNNFAQNYRAQNEVYGENLGGFGVKCVGCQCVMRFLEIGTRKTKRLIWFDFSLILGSLVC